MNGPVVIPPAYGLKDSPHATFTGDGDIEYWNNYVAVTQMGGQGTFKDDRLGVDKTLPVGTTDLVKPKLDAIRAYQFSLNAPAPAAGSFDSAAATRGQNVFSQSCASCHSGTARTNGTLHDPAETGADPMYASRSISKKYRATPLRGLAAHAPYFHDGSAATLTAVVDHYDTNLSLGLTAAQKSDLVEYLKAI
jgi:mono/diheme cytochrome c family protein